MSSRIRPHKAVRGSVIFLAVAAVLMMPLLFPTVLSAQDQQTPTGNQVMGQVEFVGKTKAEKTAGVWIDGQYVGFVNELKGDKKVLLLPGEHTISARQTGYIELTQKIVAEPGK